MESKEHHAHHHTPAHQNHHHTLGKDGVCVSLVPIFNHLEHEQMDEIKEMVQSVSYKRGEIIYRAGDPSDSLYIVSNGKIRIYRLSFLIVQISPSFYRFQNMPSKNRFHLIYFFFLYN